jgi:hypothetical protein
VLVDDGVGEARVHRLVHVPPLDEQRHAVQAVVEDRPEHRVADPLVEDVDLRRRQVDGRGPQAPEPVAQRHPFGRVDVLVQARPADPHAVPVGVRAGETRREPADAALDDQLAPAPDDRHRKPVRHQQHAPGARRRTGIGAGGMGTVRGGALVGRKVRGAHGVRDGRRPGQSAGRPARW